MTADGWVWDISLSGLGLAVVLCIAGFALVARRGIALRSRLTAYGALPIVTFARRSGAAVAGLPRTFVTASQLVPRAQRALVHLQHARDSMERSATSIARGAKAVGRRILNR